MRHIEHFSIQGGYPDLGILLKGSRHIPGPLNGFFIWRHALINHWHLPRMNGGFGREAVTICLAGFPQQRFRIVDFCGHCVDGRSEEHTSELQSLMRNSYAVFCLKKKKKNSQTDD